MRTEKLERSAPVHCAELPRIALELASCTLLHRGRYDLCSKALISIPTYCFLKPQESAMARRPPRSRLMILGMEPLNDGLAKLRSPSEKTETA